MHKVSILAFLLMFSHTAFAQRHPERIIDKSLITEKLQESFAQKPMSAETLWELGRVSAEGLTPDGSTLVYGVSNYSFENNKSEKNLFLLSLKNRQSVQFTQEEGGESVVKIDPNGDVIYLLKGQLWKKNVKGGEAVQLTDIEGGLQNVKFSPDGKYILFSKAVLVKKYHSIDKYEDLPKSNIFVYDNLDYRHWDTFNDGRFNHPFVATYENGQIGEGIDLLDGQPFYSPTAPFGGAEDYVWSPDSQSVLYVCKKKFGNAYATSTNTDIYRYDLKTSGTENLTQGMAGYDTHPVFSPDGNRLTWLSMKTDGYEADKNDILLMDQVTGRKLNLTSHWDGTVNSFSWSKDGKKIYFVAATRGTIQLFSVNVPTNLNVRSLPTIQQISEGQYDITGIVGETPDGLIAYDDTRIRGVFVSL